MKYLVLLCDGMADTQNSKLRGRTPMECADKPFIDSLAKKSEVCAKRYRKDLNPEATLRTFRFWGTTRLNTTRGALRSRRFR